MREQLSGRNKGSASPSHDLQLALDGRFAKRREFEDFLSNEAESQRSKEDSLVSQEKSKTSEAKSRLMVQRDGRRAYGNKVSNHHHPQQHIAS